LNTLGSKLNKLSQKVREVNYFKNLLKQNEYDYKVLIYIFIKVCDKSQKKSQNMQ